MFMLYKLNVNFKYLVFVFSHISPYIIKKTKFFKLRILNGNLFILSHVYLTYIVLKELLSCDWFY